MFNYYHTSCHKYRIRKWQWIQYRS